MTRYKGEQQYSSKIATGSTSKNNSSVVVLHYDVARMYINLLPCLWLICYVIEHSIYILNLYYCYFYLFLFDCILYEILQCIFTFFLNIISLVYYLYLLLYHFYYILSEYFIVNMGIPRWLTCINIICTKVLVHMVLSIGDMHRNAIQHHALPDDPFLSSFIVLYN